jgi:hypothetical protein
MNDGLHVLKCLLLIIYLKNNLCKHVDNINEIVCKLTFLIAYSRNEINDKFGICYNKLM